MGYLICDKCGGYYELLGVESPGDFDSCQCGGNLLYTEDVYHYIENQKRIIREKKLNQKLGKEDKKQGNKKIGYIFIGTFVLMLIGGFAGLIFYFDTIPLSQKTMLGGLIIIFIAYILYAWAIREKNDPIIGFLRILD